MMGTIVLAVVLGCTFVGGILAGVTHQDQVRERRRRQRRRSARARWGE